MHTAKTDLVQEINAVIHLGRSTTLVAIDGCGGAGKSTLSAALAGSIPNAHVVHSDDLAANPSHPEWRRRLLNQVIRPLLKDRRARYAHYEWRSGDLLDWHEIEPGGVVIVEGVSTLHSDLGDPWDMAIWIDCPRELRLARGVDRDGKEMRATWVDQWMPEEDEYVSTQLPHTRADFTYDGSGAGG